MCDAAADAADAAAAVVSCGGWMCVGSGEAGASYCGFYREATRNCQFADI